MEPSLLIFRDVRASPRSPYETTSIGLNPITPFGSHSIGLNPITPFGNHSIGLNPITPFGKKSIHAAGQSSTGDTIPACDEVSSVSEDSNIILESSDIVPEIIESSSSFSSDEPSEGEVVLSSDGECFTHRGYFAGQGKFGHKPVVVSRRYAGDAAQSFESWSSGGTDATRTAALPNPGYRGSCSSESGEVGGVPPSVTSSSQPRFSLDRNLVRNTRSPGQQWLARHESESYVPESSLEDGMVGLGNSTNGFSVGSFEDEMAGLGNSNTNDLSVGEAPRAFF